MAISRRARCTPKPQDIPPIIHLWLLRILVPLGAHRDFISMQGFSDDALAKLLGLERWIDPSPYDFDPKAVRAELRKLHHDAERCCSKTAPPPCLRDNVARLSELVGLSDTDCRILEFAVLIQSERILDDSADWLGQLSSVKVFHVLAALLDVPELEIRSSLSAQGILAKSGLVSVDRHGASTLRGKLDLLSDSFADHISSSSADPVSLLRDTVALGAPGQLDLADFGHIGPSLDILRPYLRRAMHTGRTGVNLFLHGAQSERM